MGSKKARGFSVTKMHGNQRLSKLGYICCSCGDLCEIMESHMRVIVCVRTIPLGHDIIFTITFKKNRSATQHFFGSVDIFHLLPRAESVIGHP